MWQVRYLGTTSYDTNFRLLILLVDKSGLVSSIVDINEPFITWTICCIVGSALAGEIASWCSNFDCLISAAFS